MPLYSGGVGSTVESSEITDDTIVNADINTAAAIDYSKLTLSNSIVNADVNTSAAIQISKITVDADLAPSQPNVYDLGSTTNPFLITYLASAGSINFGNGDVTVTAGSNTLAFAGATSGYTFADGVVSPATNDSVALGTGTLQFSDVNLASGGVVGWNNSAVTITEATSTLTIAAGTVEDTNQGRLIFNAGDGAASQAGGAIQVNGGDSGSGDTTGGSVSLNGGNSSGANAGGAVNLNGGIGGATGSGGTIGLTGGNGGSTSGAGGNISNTAGSASAGNSNGGQITNAGGSSNGSGTGGASIITGGSGATTGTGGAINITSGGGGSTSGNSGAVHINAGAVVSGTIGTINIGQDRAAPVSIAASGSTLGFFGLTPVARPASAADLTNSVTAGGTNDTVDNWTDLSTYATDAAAIRNAVYQLARKLKQVNDGLRDLGLLS